MQLSRVKAVIAAAAALVAAMVGAAWSVWSDSKPATMDAADIKSVEKGRTLYAKECAACHGANLEGQPNWRFRAASGRMPAPPHDPSGHTWHHGDQVLFNITKYGPAAYPSGYVTDMPAFADRLSDHEIAAIIAYIKSTWPNEIQARQRQASH